VKLKRNQLVKKFQLILIFSLIIGFTGCVYKPYYHPGYRGTQPAPILNSPKTGLSNYLGGTVSLGGASNKDENSITVKLQHQTNYTHKWCSFAIHADVFRGFHSVEEVEEYKGKSYNYYGVAPQVSASIYYPFTSSRLGFYGYAGKFWEYGPYVDWMEKAETEDLIWISGENFNGEILFGGAGLLYEIITDEYSITSLKLGLGEPGFIQGMMNRRVGKNVFSIQLMIPFEGNGSVSLSYMRAW
jgi:hypothetical protein